MDKDNITMVSDIDSQGEVGVKNVFVVDSKTKVNDLMNTKKEILISREDYRFILSIIRDVIDEFIYEKHGGNIVEIINSIIVYQFDNIDYHSKEYPIIDTSYYLWSLKMFKAMTNGYEVDTTKNFYVKVPYTKDYYYVKNKDKIGRLMGSVDRPYSEDIYYFCFTEKEIKALGFDNPIFEKIEIKYPGAADSL